MKFGEKTQIAVNTIFYILMVVFMIAIIVFGMQKLFFTKDIISEQERLEIRKDLAEALEYCDDPLNVGNVKKMEFRSNFFNSICILGNDFASSKYANMEGFDSLYEGGDNVVLLKTGFVLNETDEWNMADYMVVDSFDVEVDLPISYCAADKKKSGVLKFVINCN